MSATRKIVARMAGVLCLVFALAFAVESLIHQTRSDLGWIALLVVVGVLGIRWARQNAAQKLL